MPIINEAKSVTQDKPLTTEQQQSLFVAKSNELIQQARHSLSVQQNKIMLFLISKIRPFDAGGEVYAISIREFCKVCNMCLDSGKNYDDAKKAIKELADKSIWIEQEDGSEVLVRWLNRVKLNKQTNCFEVSFHEDMLPYLYNLQNKYTQYRLDNLLTMHSKYGIRLYELLKSYQYLGKPIIFTLDELCKRLDAGNYTRYPDFRRYVLETAVSDINECSDLSVEYLPRRAANSRGVSQIEFTMRELRTFERSMREYERKQRLTPEGKAERKRRARIFEEKIQKYESAPE